MKGAAVTLRRGHMRWLEKDLLLAMFGMASLLATQSLGFPLEAGRFLYAGQGMVPTTTLDVASASAAT